MDNIYNNYNKEQYGKVYNFDGEAGTIIANDNEYVFARKDILGDKNLKRGDIVVFRINHLPFANEVIEVAKFIKKEERKIKR